MCREMKAVGFIAPIVGLLLVFLHGFKIGGFKLDWIAILALFVCSIPVAARYLTSAKLPGALFRFRDEINDTRIVVDRTVAAAELLATKHKAEEDEDIAEREEDGGRQTESLPQSRAFVTFDLAQSELLLRTDPILALAALRVEIEKKLNFAVRFLALTRDNDVTARRSIDLLSGGTGGAREYISKDQADGLLRILKMCERAVHGQPIADSEAKAILELAHSLEDSFALGYSINFTPNESADASGLTCEWEHCIEHLPLKRERDEESCPVFGHDCPGGASQALTCQETTERQDREWAARDGDSDC